MRRRIDSVVTGATGLVGRWLVPALTAKGQEVGVLVRGAARRTDEYRAWVEAHGGDSARVQLFEADLGATRLGLDAFQRHRLRDARDFFHLGAAMQFGLDLEAARRVNVEGTRAFLDLAASSSELRRFVHVGGFKLGGRSDASLAQDAADPAVGAYERTKIEADRLVLAAERRGLPVTRVQPGAIIGDARTGETTQLWGFADLVRDLFRGRMPALVGGEGYWMPLVTVDHVADFLAALPEVERASEHVLIDDATPDLAELVERITRHLGLAPVRRAVPKEPLEWFLRMGGDRLTGLSAEAVSFVGEERFDVDATKRAAREMDLGMPDIEAAVLRTVDFLVATRFGAEPRARGGMKRVAGVPTFVAGAPSEADVLFLHGIPLDASSWDGVAAALPDVTSARADLPGLARTTRARAAPGAWMESLLAGHADAPWIVAHSLGTRYAVEHASRHPDRVAGLVLVSPYFLQAPPPALLRSRLGATLAFALMRDKDLVALVGEPFAAAPREWLARPGARTRIAHALADAHAVRDELATKMRALSIPVVLVTGERDPLIADAGGAEVVTIAGTGHFPQLDVPAAVAAAIAARLSPVRTSRTRRAA